MNKDDDTLSWFGRLKHFLQIEPQNLEELINLLRHANLKALIDSDTLAMIEGIILLAQMKVRDIMLPKKQMTCLKKDMSMDDALKIVTESGHSRFPVTDTHQQEILGILHAKDLLRFQSQPQNEFNLEDMARQAMFVPESKRLDLLLREFRANRNHMAIVVDEYGETTGFVTLEDIVEQIIGEIEDEFDIDEEISIKRHDHYHYIIKGDTLIEDFNEELDANFSETVYDTMGGIVMASFGCLPKNGESIELHGFEFTVINADARRIKLLECLDKRTLSSAEQSTS